MPDKTLDDTTIAVVAHGLLNSLSVVEGGLRTVRDSGQRLTDTQQDEIMSATLQHLRHVVGVLRDLALGLPPEALHDLQTVETLT